MAEPKEKSKSEIKTRAPGRINRPNMFAHVKLPIERHPIEEIINGPQVLSELTPANPAADAAVASDANNARTASLASDAEMPTEPLRNAAAAAPASVAPFAHPEQHTRFPNEYLDRVLPTLKPNEQAVLNRLYRLTWGFQQVVCKVSVSRLSMATNVSKRIVADVLNTLEMRGLIRRLEADFKSSQKIDRGLIIEMLLPQATRAKSATDANAAPYAGTAADARDAHSNRKELKETSKRESAPPDYKNCPDCQGVGYWYPEGTEKGVAKCKHEKLREGK